LENRSAKRALTIVDDRGLRSVPHPGRRIVLEAPTRVVEGTRRTHTWRSGYLQDPPRYTAHRLSTKEDLNPRLR